MREWMTMIQSNRLCRRANTLLKKPETTGEARKLLQRAVGLRRSDVRPLLVLTRLEQAAGNLEAALQLEKQAEKRNPDNPAVYIYKGQILYQQQNYEQAQQAFERVVSLDGRNGIAQNYLALCHLQQGRVDEFRRMLAEEGLWHRPDLVRAAWVQQKLPVWYLHRAAIEKRGEGLSQQIVEPDETRILSPRESLRLARKALRKNRAQQAYRILLPLSEQARNRDDYVLLFAEASVRARQPEKALEILEQKFQQKASSKNKVIQDPYFCFLLGQCRFLAGQYAESVEAYTEGEKYTTMPYYTAMMRYYSALSWLAAGKWNQAGDAIEESCRMDPLLAALIAVSLTALLCKDVPLRELIDEE